MYAHRERDAPPHTHTEYIYIYIHAYLNVHHLCDPVCECVRTSLETCYIQHWLAVNRKEKLPGLLANVCNDGQTTRITDK